MLEESRIQEVATMSGEFPSHIPVLEDKYSVEENLAQLGQQQEEEMDIQEDRQQQHSQQAEEYTTSMAATSETSTATMSQMMKAANPYLQMEQEETPGQGIESDVATEATWLDGNKNEVPRGNGASTMGFTNPAAASPSTFMGLGSAASSLPSSAPDTPMAARKSRLRHPSQSPAVVDESEQLKYRTPPATPFQPGFYRTPHDKVDERKYRLPSQARSRQQQQSSTPSNADKGLISRGGKAAGRDDDSYDGDTEF